MITPDIKNLLKNRGRLELLIKKDPSNKTLWQELKFARSRVKNSIRKLSKIHGMKILKSKDTKSAWKYIREMTFTKQNLSKSYLEPCLLNDYFAKALWSPVNLPFPECIIPENSIQFSIVPVSVGRVSMLINLLKENTATGPDGISAKLLKQLGPAIAPNIAKIFSDPSNYRPISVLPVLARIFEKEVANQFSNYCEQNNVIPPQQFGFRSKSSCEFALLHALDNWFRDIDSGHMVGALLVDLSKAFDSVSHHKLLIDLMEIGCSPSSFSWFSSYLSDRMQKVRDNSDKCVWKLVNKGVPQGSCLSPLLFNIFVRKLPGASQLLTVQFADDVTASSSGINEGQIIQNLEAGFLSIKTFCDSRDLMINETKTQWIIFKVPSKKLSDDLSIVLNDYQVKISKSVKLLGITLDQHLSFKDHVSNVSKKCRGLIGVLARSSPFLHRDLLRLAYTSLIRTHLEFSSAVFSSASKTQLNKLDVVQKISSRVICSAPRDAHAAPLLQSLNLEPLDERRNAHISSIVRSILLGNCHPALKNMFRYTTEGKAANDDKARIGFGRKRFSILAKNVYNNKFQ